MIEMFFNGGLFTTVSLVLFGVGLGCMAMEFALSGRTRFPGLDDGLVLAVLATSFTGAWVGLRMVLRATSGAGEDTVMRLGMMGLGIAVIPLVFGAVQAVVLGGVAVAVQATIGPDLRAVVRPASTLHGVTVAALACLVLSLGAGAGFCHVFYTALPTSSSVATPLQTTHAQLWIDGASGLGLGAMALAALMITMGIAGGMRGLNETGRRDRSTSP